jgi:tetratricopeptide (TPR) repeat protein
MMLMRRCVEILLAVTCIAASGCAANPKGALDQAVVDFNQQRYTQAHQKAKAIADRPSSPNRHDAAYIAGMSAYQLGQIDEAERQLQTAINADNAETAARAKAVLGQIRLDQRRWRDAALLLTQAADTLSGEDRLRAAANASLAYQNLGDLDSARTWRAMASGRAPQNASPSSPSSSSGDALPTVVTSAPGGGKAGSTGFTLQVGAFQEKKRAESAAKEALRVAQREGWGQARIIPRRDERGRPTYLVQIGAFPTRESAAAARARIGRLDYIVAVANSKAS